VTNSELPPRDQAPTPFADILRELCRRTGGDCAVLVDDEGETVDYWGRLDPFSTRVFAAELAILHASARSRLGLVEEIFVRNRYRSFVIRALPEGYAFALRLPRRAASVSERALASAERQLSLEAGFPWMTRPQSRVSCRPVGIEERDSRPLSLRQGEAALSIDIIGRVKSPAEKKREQGFRVRLENGEEGTLIREPLGRWYLDDEP
jgi:hypothetical protein